DGPAPELSHALLHRFFEAQARRTPAATALVCGGRTLSYSELDVLAERLAGRLRRLGAGADRRVGICLERSPELVVAILAVLKSGSAYLPLDPAYPPARLAFMLRDAAPGLLLSQTSLRAQLPLDGLDPAPRVLCLDAPEEESAPEEQADTSEMPEAAVWGESLAYLIYTSGSTGTPKGVAIPHRAAAHLVEWALDAFGPERLDGMLAATSTCFDLSIFELFAPLACGGTVVLARDVLALREACAAAEAAGHAVRLVNTVPSAMAELLRAGALPGSVRTVNLAGEPLRRALSDALYAAGVERVYDLYGPSEDTTYSTWVLREAGGPETIGRPLPGTQAYVLDERLEPVPVGMPGELYLGGMGLARGYLGRAELTAGRFVPDPFGATPGGRLYRTGDRVRFGAAGRLEYLGRRDGQVKVRGFRIELGEIEDALLEQAAVGQAVVQVRGRGEERRLVGYVVPAGGAEVEVGALRRALQERLPGYMVPSAVVVLEALPQLPNGKVDRGALPEPAASATGESEGPRTPVEEVLAGIWAEVLGVERVGVHESFFELGG
ncbi:MAG TPA: amino acid adenylation domain-containing protein, partial [Longimicrobiaceae bacterium]|nr:amino acid adenylation domain-containing protein [Longimicrobiaceae bacterium]